MKIGVIFPQTEIGTDAGAIREYATAVERMGYSHILAYDHVLGANTESRPDWTGYYRLDSTFHEPLVLFSYMAGVTSRIGFFTGILILPQRQTVLVAKQTACLDVLCGGRLQLGIGTGWNEVEYEALGMRFAGRGKMIEEQIDLLRSLWTNDAVTLDTPLHKVTDAGINPLPIQKPIPIWMGGGSDRPDWRGPAKDKVIRRIARMADGWLPMWEPGPRADELMGKLREFCREYGRDPAKIGLGGRFHALKSQESSWSAGTEAWQKLGATHISVNTMEDGLNGAEEHLRRLEEFRPLITGE